MNWTHYQDQSGFSFDYPVGWRVETTPFPSCIVTSPDRLWIALIQPLPIQPGLSPADVILKGQFPTTHLFPGAVPANVVNNGPGAAEGDLYYRAGDGSQAVAKVVYVNYGQIGMLCAIGAPRSTFTAAEPMLTKIIRSQNQGMQTQPQGPSPHDPKPQNPASPGQPPVAPQPVQFTRFVEPQRGTYTLEAPIGWKVAGGFHHPGLGDRRSWFEANSADGIYILSDPTFPHTLCHMKGARDGNLVDVGAGGTFLTLKPGAASAADCYIRQAAARRFAGFTQVQRRPRPDVVKWLIAKAAAAGNQIGRAGHVEAVETIFERKTGGLRLILSVLTTSAFDGNYGVGTGFWSSNNIAYLAPENLVATAELVRNRMVSTFGWTPVAFQIHQQDEAQIYANAQMQNAMQWNWFNNQQKIHDIQNAAGQAYVDNYWQQQRANDAMVRGWEQNQSVYDRLSQDRSDAMLGRQRLADDTTGQFVDAPAGSNHYYRNQKTGEVIGTDIHQPPDYTNNYTELKKL